MVTIISIQYLVFRKGQWPDQAWTAPTPRLRVPCVSRPTSACPSDEANTKAVLDCLDVEAITGSHAVVGDTQCLRGFMMVDDIPTEK